MRSRALLYSAFVCLALCLTAAALWRRSHVLYDGWRGNWATFYWRLDSAAGVGHVVVMDYDARQPMEHFAVPAEWTPREAPAGRPHFWDGWPPGRRGIGLPGAGPSDVRPAWTFLGVEGEAGDDFVGLTVPYRLLVPATLLPAVLVAALRARRVRRRRARARRGLCPACGYDLRGSRGDRCPECGERAVPSPSPAPAPAPAGVSASGSRVTV